MHASPRHGTRRNVLAVALVGFSVFAGVGLAVTPAEAAPAAQSAPAIPSTVYDNHRGWTDVYYQRPWVKSMGPLLTPVLDKVTEKAGSLTCAKLPEKLQIDLLTDACEKAVTKAFQTIGTTQLKAAMQKDACVRVRFAAHVVYAGHAVVADPKFCLRSVGGSIGEKWMATGGRGGPLGYATTDELKSPDGIGRFNHFLGGSIYWSPSTGAHVVGGSIKARWSAMGWEGGRLGYPTSDELVAGDGIGRKSMFQHGAIYYSAGSATHSVYGSILEQYRRIGEETSRVGYPTTEEFDLPGGGRQVYFQHGCRIEWRPGTAGLGTFVICNS